MFSHTKGEEGETQGSTVPSLKWIFDINKVKVISELLCIRHSYFNLECFNSEDIDFMIEFMRTD